jgi:hypothetical protein
MHNIQQFVGHLGSGARQKQRLVGHNLKGPPSAPRTSTLARKVCESNVTSKVVSALSRRRLTWPPTIRRRQEILVDRLPLDMPSDLK